MDCYKFLMVEHSPEELPKHAAEARSKRSKAAILVLDVVFVVALSGHSFSCENTVDIEERMCRGVDQTTNTSTAAKRKVSCLHQRARNLVFRATEPKAIDRAGKSFLNSKEGEN